MVTKSATDILIERVRDFLASTGCRGNGAVACSEESPEDTLDWCGYCLAGRLTSVTENQQNVIRNIRLVAGKGAAFGQQPKVHIPELIIQKKDEALTHVLRFCAQAGVEGSLLR